MKQYAEGSSLQILQQSNELTLLKQALKQERDQAALACEETESFRQQLQKLKGYVKDAQNEAKEAKNKAALLQQKLTDEERNFNNQNLQKSSQITQFQRQTTVAETENLNYKARLEKLASLLREREKKIAELQQYEISFRKVSEQKSLHDSIIEKHLERIHFLENEVENASQNLEASRHKVEQLESTVQTLRQQQASNQEEMQALQLQFDLLKKTIDDSQKHLEASSNRQKELELFLQATESVSLDDQLLKLAALKEQLRTSEEAASDKEAVQAERDALKEALAQAKNAQEEGEARLKTAHQHLAKKVKESALLNDSIQLHQEQMLELQTQFNQSRMRIAEMQHALDGHVQQESRLQEQIQHSSKSMEALASRWEEKYFKVYEKWQEAEVRIREMKKLEEKYSQMQSLLSNISGVFGMPVVNAPQGPQIPPPASFIDMATQLPAVHDHVATTPVTAAPVHEEKPTLTGFYGQLAQPHLHNDADDIMFAVQPLEGVKNEDAEEKTAKEPYQSLFDLPQQAKRPKNTLFD